MTFMIVQNFILCYKLWEKILHCISNINIYSFQDNCSFTVKIKTICWNICRQINIIGILLQFKYIIFQHSTNYICLTICLSKKHHCSYCEAVHLKNTEIKYQQFTFQHSPERMVLNSSEVSECDMLRSTVIPLYLSMVTKSGLNEVWMSVWLFLHQLHTEESRLRDPIAGSNLQREKHTVCRCLQSTFSITVW